MSNNIKAIFNKLYVGNTEIDANSNVNITGNISTAGNLSVSGTLTLLDSNSSNINNLVCNKIITSGLITANNGITCNNKNINLVADPVNINDAVNKNYIDNLVFQSINNYLINNSIQIQKLLFTGDGTKALFDDGTFKVISSTTFLVSNYSQITNLHGFSINFSYLPMPNGPRTLQNLMYYSYC
jgi:hypothetical protein